MSNEILTIFDQQRELYEIFTSKVALLIQELLSENGINVHSVTRRTKDRQSLVKKLSKLGNNYLSLGDITDVAGVRITTYLEDDVDRVAKILNNEFRIDVENSVDKRALLDPDRFGYLSTHHVVQLSAVRCALPEYQRFTELKLEIQTRSILQHAWAEIEHDLGYKSIREVPREIRRRFSRLSSLLELADSEFIQIRDQLHLYNETVLEKINTKAETMEVNKDTLMAFVGHRGLVKKIDDEIVKVTGGLVSEDLVHFEKLLDILNFFQINTIAELTEVLTLKRGLIVRFSQVMLDDFPMVNGKLNVLKGTSIFYLGYVLAASAEDTRKVDEYLEAVGLVVGVASNLADVIRGLYAKIIFEAQ